MNVGPLELIVLLFLILLAFGGRRLPQAGRGLGGGIRNLLDSARGMHPEDEAPKPELEESSSSGTRG